VGVAFSGDSTNLPAILGGHVPVAILDYVAAKTSIDAKKLKPLACCSEKRADFAPDIPTIVELGYELTFVSLVGVLAPKGTPDEVVKKIEALVGKISEEKEFRAKLNNMCLKLNYQNSVTYQKNLAGYIENIKAFFKEEGLVK
jgi:tripartite-type tricarboxylate transporter receptor subunit TctC